jgi:integrase
MTDLSRKRDRDQLQPRREPYWQRLGSGAYLGFRRGPETWIARYRGRDEKQRYNSLGEALEFDEAKKRAEDWLAQFAQVPVRAAKRDTVAAALDAYLVDLKRHGRADAARSAEGRFRTALGVDFATSRYADALAETQLDQTTHEDFLEWRDRLAKGRLPRTVNRLVRAVSAGLNRAHRLGHIGNPAAWRLEGLPDDEESETAIFLTRAQRNGLIDAASPAAAAFLRGLELTGARPKELATARVGDFDGERLKLSHRKGRPPKLRSRYVVLDDERIAFFKSQAKDKLPAAPLFTEDGQKPWRRDMWAAEIRTAIASHNKAARGLMRIPSDASAYSFRHARISELLQVYGVDPLTVGAQTGTSLRMIERTYYKFIPSVMREKLTAITKGTNASSAK